MFGEGGGMILRRATTDRIKEKGWELPDNPKEVSKVWSAK